MDPFETATQFSQMLRNLKPSSQALTRAAHFALKHSDHEDYLFPSVMGIVGDENVELNTKAVLFQFVEVLLTELVFYLRQPKFNFPYVDNIKLLLPQLILHVLPGSTSTNLYSVFASLKQITSQLKIPVQDYVHKYHSVQPTDHDITMIAANVPFPEPDFNPDPEQDPVESAWELLINKKRQSQYERRRLCENQPAATDTVSEPNMFSIKPKSDPQTQLLLKGQMITRMEDDREAHKRSKETLWQVSRPKDVNFISEDEFLNHYWEKIPCPTGEADETLMHALEDLNHLVTASYKDRQV